MTSNEAPMPERPDALSLCEADQLLLDALIDCGCDQSRVPQALGRSLSPQEQQRVDRLHRLFCLMNDYPVEDAEPALLHATLARIDRHEDARSERLRFDSALEQQQARRGFRIRVPDFMTVAAALLIAAGVLWPVLGTLREKSIQASCAQNLSRIGYAFSQYANDHNGALPISTAGVGGTWDTFENLLNLNPLMQGGYCAQGHLECPGHQAHAEKGLVGLSYSYRWFTPRAVLHWNTGRVTVILGDLNPLIDAARSGYNAAPLSVSVNHGGRGQNVLATDGATLWLEQPLLGQRDNIWMPDHADILRPGLQPADDSDVFLAH